MQRVGDRGQVTDASLPTWGSQLVGEMFVGCCKATWSAF